jgi:hypothetical protein
VFVASRCDRFWCKTGAVIAACLREALDCLIGYGNLLRKRAEMHLVRRRPWRRTVA